MSEAQPGPLAPSDPIDLLGHAAAEAVLLDSWKSGRMPHAWLLTGPRGIGKASLAYRAARFVLSQPATQESGLFGEADPPETAETLALPADHAVTARVAAGGHADLRVLQPGMPHPDTGRPTRRIVVSQVRRAVQFTNMTSAEEGWRVVLVDPADELNANAQNAILKVLEEPPANVLFLLVSHAPGRLLPTIRSRCRRLTLPPLPGDTVLDLLARYCPDMEVADCQAVAGLADGSIGDAMALAQSGGLDLYRTVVRLMGSLDRPDIPAIHALGDAVSRSTQTPDPFATLRDLIGRWLARLVLTAARRENAVEIMPGEADIMENLAARGSLEQWLEVWEKVTRLLQQADSANLDRKQAVVSVFLTAAAVLQMDQRPAR